jgi:lipopolysaccharide transport system permease protein
VISDRWGNGARLAWSVNPVVGVIDVFRWCLLGGQSQICLPGLAVSVAVMAVMMWLGVRKFRAMEKSFADII